jgi:heme-degrading monooxygenase HmoA
MILPQLLTAPTKGTDTIMITVGLYYDVTPGNEKLFEEKFEEVLNALEGQPGHKVSYLYQQVKRPHSYAILSEWEQQKDFTSFIKSDLFRQVTNWGLDGILENRPSHKVYGQNRDLA